MTQGILLTLFALLLYGVWGFSYKLLSIKEIQGEWVVAVIMLFGAVISASLAVARAEPFPLGKLSGNIPWLVLAASSGALGNIMLVRAMASPGISSGVALAISGAYPLVAALLDPAEREAIERECEAELAATVAEAEAAPVAGTAPVAV